MAREVGELVIMLILDAGHRYKLDCLDGEETQLLIFVKRHGDKFPFNNNSYPGTNCQEVLRALIDRCEYLNNQSPCAETESIIGNLRSALTLFELRAARKHNRFLDLKSSQDLMYRVPCNKCKHIGCSGDCHI